MPDVDAAEALLDNVSRLMVSVADRRTRDQGSGRRLQARTSRLGAALRRLGIDYPNKFDDLWRWCGRRSDGGMPQYRDRRAFISELFAPVRKALTDQGDASRELAEGVDDPAVCSCGRRLNRFSESEPARGALNPLQVRHCGPPC